MGALCKSPKGYVKLARAKKHTFIIYIYMYNIHIYMYNIYIYIYIFVYICIYIYRLYVIFTYNIV